MTEIPDWIEEKITFDRNRDVQDRHIVEVFLESDRPYLSSRAVATEIGLTKQGTRPRLEELEEIRVLDGDTVAGGRIFWIHDDRSEWPIPPDVEVVPITDEMTISEFLQQLHVQYGLLAVAATMIGGLFMMAFTLGLAYNIQTPIVQPSELLLGGLLLIFIGYTFVLLAFGYGVWNRYSTSE